MTSLLIGTIINMRRSVSVLLWSLVCLGVAAHFEGLLVSDDLSESSILFPLSNCGLKLPSSTVRAVCAVCMQCQPLGHALSAWLYSAKATQSNFNTMGNVVPGLRRHALARTGSLPDFV